MASILFVDYQTVIPASWLNDVNAMVYSGTVPANTLTVNNLVVNTSLSGSGVTALFASPPAIGGTAANTGAFTTLSASSTVTISSGTANGVAYLNGSKVLTTGSVLTFDGLNGGTTGSWQVGNLISIGGGYIRVNRSDNNTYNEIKYATGDLFYFNQANGGAYQFNISGSEQMRLTNTGLGISTSSPAYPLHVNSSAGLASIGLTGGEIGATSYQIRQGITGVSNPGFSLYDVTNSATRLAIDSSGNVLINTTSAVAGSKLVVASGDANINGLTVGRGGGSVSTNTANGLQALFNNTTGYNNTANGLQALYSNTTGYNNTAVGYQAGHSNTTGTTNVFVGQSSGYSSATGNSITAIGQNSYGAATGATGGTFIGNTSGYSTSGPFNTFVGTSSGYLVTTGSKNTILGSYSGNQGGLDIRTASNYIVLSDGDGNPLVTTYNGGSVSLAGATPKAGTGITFPATQSASSDANTLDDYEEGTWTPDISTGAGASVTYANRGGRYTKVGRQVFCQGWVEISSAATWGGFTHCRLAGLPFGVVTTNGSAVAFSYGGTYAQNSIFQLGDITGAEPITGGASDVYLQRGQFGGIDTVYVKTSNLNTTGYVSFSLQYTT